MAEGPSTLESSSQVDNEKSYSYLPQTYWGLDPLHRAFVKMFIRDVLEMDNYPGHPALNVYAYKNHPISRVDLLGWVVRVEEREKLFNYAIDDGTGVIGCTCWKPRVQSTTGKGLIDDNDYSTTGASTSANSAEQEFVEFLASKMQEIKKCVRQLRQPVKLGDLLHVRGRIKSYRGRREVGAAYFHLVVDPTCSTEIRRTMEQLQLYQDFYDVPFQLPRCQEGGDSSEAGVVKSLQDAIANFLSTNSTVLNFEIKELATVDSLMAIVQKARKENDSTINAKQVFSLFTRAVGGLEELGIVYKSDKDNLYVVIDRDATLESSVLDIVRRESQKPKYSESGCHYRHILDCLRTNHRFSGVSPNVVVHILDKLESQSDVISTSENYYIAF
ncbi:CST complex subunit STN1-like [Branchiostoma lanceolatum]|uniref:CST complex subunit STN1-like n=1 Tax=Branchiostoma lanceolatum TaxID=7740 RepID=UPI003451B906